MPQLKLLKDGLVVKMKEYLATFCMTTNGRCAFVARNEALLENQARKFVEAVQRGTQAHLISIDLAAESRANRTPADAIYAALTKLAEDDGIAFEHNLSKLKLAAGLCEKLAVRNDAGLLAQPIVFIQHFQNCILTINPANLSDYLHLRELPCKLIITSNMDLSDIELVLPIATGSTSVLPPLFKSITIETDVPFKRSEWRIACGLE